MSVIEVRNLKHTYNPNTPFYKDALQSVDFVAHKKEIIGIIGPTGSGKSTLVQHLNGLLKPTSGEILLNGKDIWEEPKKINQIRSKVGLVFQYPEYQLFEETVYKDIAFGPQNMGFKDNELNKKVMSAVKAVKLPLEYLERSPFDLSGGEKRRVAIAGVLAMQPEVIVFDEPTAGLDPVGRETVMDIIKNYRNDFQATVFIVSHSMEDLAKICDKILVMYEGNSVMFDTPKKVFSDKEFLNRFGLDVPLITKVMLALKEVGYDVPSDIITVAEAEKFLLSVLKGGENNA